MSEFEAGYKGFFAGANRGFYGHSDPALQGWDTAQREVMEANAKADEAAAWADAERRGFID